MAETEAETWRIAAYEVFLTASAYFLIQHRPIQSKDGTTHNGLALLHQSLVQKMLYRFAYSSV